MNDVYKQINVLLFNISIILSLLCVSHIRQIYTGWRQNTTFLFHINLDMGSLLQLKIARTKKNEKFNEGHGQCDNTNNCVRTY